MRPAVTLLWYNLDKPTLCRKPAFHGVIAGGNTGKHMIRVDIDSIRVSLMSQDRVVVLRERESDRYLVIWIGPFEAEAIRVELQGVEVPRPLTHDLLKSVIVELGGQVEYVVVNDLRNDVFYARLKIRINGRTVEIDSRPSDAIALAVRLKVPIYVAETVMDRAAIEPEKEITSEADLLEGEIKPPLEEGETAETEDEEDLGIFKDFLNSLDLDDLEDNE
jgi:bifunctional DNase/RNase